MRENLPCVNFNTQISDAQLIRYPLPHLYAHLSRYLGESFVLYPTQPSNYGVIDLSVYFKIVKIVESIKTTALAQPLTNEQ